MLCEDPPIHLEAEIFLCFLDISLQSACSAGYIESLGFISCSPCVAVLSLNASHTSSLFCLRKSPTPDSCNIWRCFSKRRNGLENPTLRLSARGIYVLWIRHNFPFSKKICKDWRSSKPVSIASSSNTCSHSDRVSSANQTTQNAKTVSLGCLRCLARHQHFSRVGISIWCYPDFGGVPWRLSLVKVRFQ